MEQTISQVVYRSGAWLFYNANLQTSTSNHIKVLQGTLCIFYYSWDGELVWIIIVSQCKRADIHQWPFHVEQIMHGVTLVIASIYIMISRLKMILEQLYVFYYRSDGELIYCWFWHCDMLPEQKKLAHASWFTVKAWIHVCMDFLVWLILWWHFFLAIHYITQDSCCHIKMTIDIMRNE